MKKDLEIFVIKKVFISDGVIETDVELYRTKADRDYAWNVLVHDHNNMIQNAYEIDLSDPDSWEDKFFYEWDDETLEFYDIVEPDCHRDFFEKGVEYV